MKTLFIECSMGAAGDMLTAALLELLEDPRQYFEAIAPMRKLGVEISSEKAEKCGIVGTHMKVCIHGVEEHSHDVHTHEDLHAHTHSHTHASHDDINALIRELPIPQSVKERAGNVYRRIAEAEAAVHGKPVQSIHFHEVGALDAVADVVSVCLLMDLIRPEKIVVSPIHVGSGLVRCAHGVLPVPTPATAMLLKGIPIVSGAIRGELCTPTGAALLAEFADSFSEMPAMTIERIGYGMGTKDFPAANCMRAFLGRTMEEKSKSVVCLECNIDDMTGEDIGRAMEILMESGARDAYLQSIQMKKNRPGFLLSCICDEESAETFARLIFTHTTTIGIRRRVCERYTLSRHTETRTTPYGDIRVKFSSGYGVERVKAEYDDLCSIAEKQGLPMETLRGELHSLL